MRLSRKLMVAVSAAITIGGSMRRRQVPSRPRPSTARSTCRVTRSELDNESASAFTGLAPGTEVCIKAGNQITIVVVVTLTSFIENTEITNGQGKAKGISYYAFGEGPTTVPTVLLLSAEQHADQDRHRLDRRRSCVDPR